jgi:hemolysin activation/secretion protein
VDFGWGWNQKISTPDPTTLTSVGLGLRWAATLVAAVPVRAQFEVFWGYKLQDVDVDTEGGDLQDHGLHLQFVVAAF